MKVSELIAKLQEFDQDTQIAVENSAGRGSTWFNVEEILTQSDFYGARPLWIYGNEPSLPIEVTIMLSSGGSFEGQQKHNREIARRRGEFIPTPEWVRTSPQLDPKPWVYTDPVSHKTTRLPFSHGVEGAPLEWAPRPLFSDMEKDYV